MDTPKEISDLLETFKKDFLQDHLGFKPTDKKDLLEWEEAYANTEDDLEEDLAYLEWSLCDLFEEIKQVPTAVISMPKQPKQGDSVSILGHNFYYKELEPAIIEDMNKEDEDLTTFDKVLIFLFLGFWLMGVVAFVQFFIDHLFIFAL